MKFSKKTRAFAAELVNCYAKRDDLSDKYELCIDDIDDFQLEKLAAHIYMDNPDYIDEATGANNKAYDRLMMPALLMHLKNSLDHDSLKEFSAVWLKGVTDYARRVMDRLLMDELEIYNMDNA